MIKKRHRWIKPDPHSDISVCRDCGLEIATHRVQPGGNGECPGKMWGQRGLPLVSSEAQIIGNQNPETDYGIDCIGCGVSVNLKMYAHRSPRGAITGFLFACDKCAPYVMDRSVQLVDPVTKTIEEGQANEQED